MQFQNKSLGFYSWNFCKEPPNCNKPFSVEEKGLQDETIKTSRSIQVYMRKVPKVDLQQISLKKAPWI